MTEIKLQKTQMATKYQHRHVVALVASIDLKTDHEMAIEFAAAHALIPCNPETSKWYSPVPIRRGAEDTQSTDAANAILTSSPPFETVLPQSTSGFIFVHFDEQVKHAIEKLTEEDTLVIVLIGHRPFGCTFLLSPDGQIISSADELDVSAWGAKCRIVVVIPCCNHEYWRSPQWTLLTTADRNTEGVFTKIYQASSLPGAAPMDVLDWFDELRGAGCSQSDSVSAPQPPPPAAHLLHCIPPSERTLPQPAPDPLSAQEEAELGSLCEHFKMLPERHFYPEITLLQSSYEYSSGILEDDFKPGVYKMLSRRKKRCARAMHIAATLGWNIGEELGNPADQAAMPPSTEEELRERAERSGCHVSTLVMEDPSWEWTVAADWLAKAWEAAGCPEVSEQEWEAACN